MYIKPAMVRTQDGLVLANVYDPDRRDRIPPEGRDVPETGYWIRRLMEGGVVRVEAPKEEIVAASQDGNAGDISPVGSDEEPK